MSTLWIKPYDLNLKGVKRDTNGEIISGWVINGGWFFERNNGEILCRTEEDGHIVTRFREKQKITEVDEPEYK